MRLRTLLLLVLSAATPHLLAQASPSAGTPVEFAFSYTAVHANFAPSLCECFWPQGGAGEIGFNLRPHVALVGEIAAQHLSNINAAHANLGLASFLIGPRLLARPHATWQPYAHVLAGVTHGFDSQFPVNNALAYSATAFAMTAGGGLDVALSPRVSLRLVEADFYLTRLPNDANNNQNNLRVSAGIVFHLTTAP